MTAAEPFSFAADFPVATHDEWRRLVDSALKGAPFQRLEGKTYDRLTIEPLYERAVAARSVTGRAPGAVWTLMQRVDHPDPAIANAQALEDLENGATGLVLVFAGSVSANGFGLAASAASVARVLDGIDLTGAAVDLNLSPATRHVVRDIAALVKSRGMAPAAVDLRFSINPIGGFAASGKSARGWDELAKSFAAMISELAGAGFRGPFAVADGRIIHNAGGSEAQELAFALASAVAYLRALEAGGIALEAARDAIYFRLTADADQFLTVAKFRAARKMWARIEAACGLTPKSVMVTAETAWRMMTRRDPYVNMLRSTVAVAAAGFGGADAITVLPHTAPLGLPDAFARRVARNTQLVLVEESNLARVADPAAGSGAHRGANGCSFAPPRGRSSRTSKKPAAPGRRCNPALIQNSVATVRAERQKAVARGRDVLTGTNAYPDLHETLPAVLDVAPVKPAPEETGTVTAEALPRLRLAEPFEQLRERSDKMLAKTGARPKIFLANLGTPAEFTARASFAKNFFEAGGIEAVGGDGDGPALCHGLQATRRTPLACLCSSDKVYEKDASCGRRGAQGGRSAPHLSRRAAGRARGGAAGGWRAILHLRGLRRTGDTDRRLRYSGAERVNA